MLRGLVRKGAQRVKGVGIGAHRVIVWCAREDE